MSMVSDTEQKPLSVSQLTGRIRAILESRFGEVWVEGEISNWNVAASGHAYFALKDQGALLSVVMWRTSLARSGGLFKDGDQVEVRGNLSVYDKRGQYQLVASSMKSMGEGLLWQRFLALKAKLESEGLFESERKRPLATLPRAVGVVTSPTSAAVRDILSVFERRAPGLRIVIWPTLVQGEGAAEQIAEGIRVLGESGEVDAILMARGGGSLEDLWAFNDESLARAIVASPVPVVSGVGHETDFSISDFVADLRAPTPTAGAELISADQAQVRDLIRDLDGRLDRSVSVAVNDVAHRLELCEASPTFRDPTIKVLQEEQRVDDLTRRLDLNIAQRLEKNQYRLDRAKAAFAGHDPALILNKGYAIIKKASTDKVVTRTSQLKPGVHVMLEMQDGRSRAIVAKDEADLFEDG